MARKYEAAAHLRAGKNLKQIASDMGISLQSVAQYLYTKVGEGTVKRSDILFSIEPNIRKLIEDLIQQLGKVDCNSIYGAARRQGHRLAMRSWRSI
jgi:predicted transcriptional regulator